MIRVERVAGTLLITPRDRNLDQDTFDSVLKRLQALPGRRFDKKTKVNKVPATTNVIRAVVESFPDASLDEESKQLLEQARRAYQATALKEADDLPDFPGKTEGWMHQRRGFWFAVGVLGEKDQ